MFVFPFFRHSQIEKTETEIPFPFVSIKQNLQTSIYVHDVKAKYTNLHFPPLLLGQILRFFVSVRYHQAKFLKFH